MRRFMTAILLGLLLSAMVAGSALAGDRPWLPGVDYSTAPSVK
jgi:hypothetical protein